MPAREIVSIPESVLRRKARNVTDFGSELQTLINDMVETMRKVPGVGLAAPQIDVPLRLIVVEFGDEEDENVPVKLKTVINPEIIRFSKEMILGTEECLSIPGFMGDVERASNVMVKGLNRNGNPIRIRAKGWLARIFQHEVDHLDGVLYIDRAEHVWKAEGETVQALPGE